MNIYMYNWPESSTVKPNTTQYCQKSRNNFNSRVFGSLITGSRRINWKKKRRMSLMLQIFNTRNTTGCKYRFLMGVYIWTRDKVSYHSDDRDQHSKIPCCPWGLQHTKQKTIQHTKQSAIQSYKPYTIFSSHNLGQIRM